MSDISIKGIDALFAKLEKVRGLDFAKIALEAAALHIQGKINKYPPSTIANDPGQRRWYERGYGPRWTRKDGTVNGYKTSERLDASWTIEERNNGLTWIIGTSASYAPFVQDADRQARVHVQNGWPTAQGVVAEETERVLDMFRDEIMKAFDE